jgi:hypothetical protein
VVCAFGLISLTRDKHSNVPVQMPTEATDVRMVSRCSRFDMDRLKGIFRAYGWPSENYRKEECMEKVKEAWDEILDEF